MRQVLRAGALGRPRGIGWRRRWEGGSGWGTHINPWLIHVNVWQKSLQYCKVTSLQLIKIKKKKRNELLPFATTSMDLESIMLSEMSDRERQIWHDITYMWNIVNITGIIYN